MLFCVSTEGKGEGAIRFGRLGIIFELSKIGVHGENTQTDFRTISKTNGAVVVSNSRYPQILVVDLFLFPCLIIFSYTSTPFISIIFSLFYLKRTVSIQAKKRCPQQFHAHLLENDISTVTCKAVFLLGYLLRFGRSCLQVGNPDEFVEQSDEDVSVGFIALLGVAPLSEAFELCDIYKTHARPIRREDPVGY